MLFGQLSDTELILVVLLLFYLSECVCWLPAGAVCLWTGWRRYRLRRTAGFLQNTNGGLVFSSLWPTGRLMLCPAGWLIALKKLEQPAAAPLPAASVATADTPAGDDPKSDGTAALTGETEGASGTNSATSDSADIPEAEGRAEEAENAALTASVAPGQPGDRFSRMLAWMTDVGAIRARVEEYEQATAMTGSLGAGLFLIVFFGGPLFYYTSEQPDLVRLAVFLGLTWLYWMLTVLFFRGGHRRLYPGETGERRRRLLMMCFSPAVAMRSRDLLARPLLTGFHPVAVATVLCRKDQLEEFGRDELLRLIHPLPEESAIPPVARGDRSENECRQLLRERLEECLREAGVDPAALLAPPVPDPDAHSYCPRCRRQSIEAAGLCPDCVAIALQPFPAVDTAAAEAEASADDAPGEHTAGAQAAVEPAAAE